uniref:Uncharacterized protein n=1 Tax=Percolomonas cosmopolitus TaxID=63605 RepID=A0A7S1PGB2_9EUKA|mmetsp:Transcript_1618/g.5589  ORF Transcript_1618/g.5589 Transcript_1618/m.5589 type:complete len:135 (+) Transcript_1618:260-664(+)
MSFSFGGSGFGNTGGGTSGGFGSTGFGNTGQQQQQQQHQTQFQPQNAFCFQPSSSFANNNGVKKHSFKSTASITNGKENRKQRLQQKRQQKRSQILSESRNQNSAFGWTLTVDMTPSGSRSSAKKKSGFPRHLR